MGPIVALAESTGLEASALEHAAQYGVVGFLCVVFAVVIHRLYKENRCDRRDASEKEKRAAVALAKCQEGCRAKEIELRGEYEARYRELAEWYMEQLANVRTFLEKREDEIRRDTALLVERLANSNRESNETLVAMLKQFLDRVIINKG